MKTAAVAVKGFWLPVIVCGLLACSVLHFMPGLLHSECEMTYMFTRPHYQKLNISQKLQRTFPQYSLHLYRETLNREEPTLDWTPLRLRGLPALFIPGNAGSHKQGVCVKGLSFCTISITLLPIFHLVHFHLVHSSVLCFNSSADAQKRVPQTPPF